MLFLPAWDSRLFGISDSSSTVSCPPGAAHYPWQTLAFGPIHSLVSFLFFLFFLFFIFLGPHLRHMEFPRLGVELERQLPAYTAAMGTQNPSHIYDLQHSLWQRQILNPPSEARDQTCILTETILGS